MRQLRTILSGVVTVVAMNVGAQNRLVVFQSAPTQTTLLELFTSEGCSSCPPAEAWLSRLKESPVLWRDFVPVAFHVDYWDRLGWRDPWASKQFSDRQRAYAASWGTTVIYTPGFVLDGREWGDWRRSKEGPRPSGATAGVLKVSSGDRKEWQVRFAPADRSGGWYEVHAALLAGDLTSDVKAGENRGRRLNHDFVVTAFAKAGLKPAPEGLWGQVVLADSPKGRVGRRAVAVWVSRSGSLKPVQAVGGWLR